MLYLFSCCNLPCIKINYKHLSNKYDREKNITLQIKHFFKITMR